MWPYHAVSRNEFEKRKDLVDKFMLDLGCEALNIELPYEQKTTMHSSDFEETWYSQRQIYQYKNCYYRIDEVLFREKPFIVLECADTLEEVYNNRMEDADPFPYDLSDADMMKALKYSLSIEIYPDD